MTQNEAPTGNADRLPGLMGEYTDEQLNEHTIKHAKYFTVVQINRGGFVGGGKNYDRHQVDTLEDARSKAKELYENDPTKRGILIYAVADFAGANGFSRPVENFPKSTWESKAQKADREKKARADARQAAREARTKVSAPRVSKPVESPQILPKGDDAWMDYDAPMAMVTDEED